MFICVCNAITERDVLAAVAKGAQSLSDLQGQLGLASCCGACAEVAQQYLPGGCYAVCQGQAASTPWALRQTELSAIHTGFQEQTVSRSLR